MQFSLVGVSSLRNKGSELTTVTGPLCYLRELVSSDIESFLSCMADPNYLQFTELGALSRELARRILDWAHNGRQETPRTRYCLAAARNGDGTMIGWCTLIVRDIAVSEGDIGFVINPAHSGSGYGTATAQALATFGFQTLRLSRLIATCDPHNLASARVLQKSGFVFDCHMPNYLMIYGQWRDRIRFTLEKPMLTL